MFFENKFAYENFTSQVQRIRGLFGGDHYIQIKYDTGSALPCFKISKPRAYDSSKMTSKHHFLDTHGFARFDRPEDQRNQNEFARRIRFFRPAGFF